MCDSSDIWSSITNATPTESRSWCAPVARRRGAASPYGELVHRRYAGQRPSRLQTDNPPYPPRDPSGRALARVGASRPVEHRPASPQAPMDGPPEKKRSTSMRGQGRIFQRTYRNRRTGELKSATTYTVEYYVN